MFRMQLDAGAKQNVTSRDRGEPMVVQQGNPVGSTSDTGSELRRSRTLSERAHNLWLAITCRRGMRDVAADYPDATSVGNTSARPDHVSPPMYCSSYDQGSIGSVEASGQQYQPRLSRNETVGFEQDYDTGMAEFEKRTSDTRVYQMEAQTRTLVDSPQEKEAATPQVDNRKGGVTKNPKRVLIKKYRTRC